MELNELIEKASKIFESYKIGKTLAVCKACCVTDDEEAELVNSPLRTTTSNILWRAYYESARNFSDRELLEMKHFLPRVLELVNNFDVPCHSPEIVFTRLGLHKPEQWKKRRNSIIDRIFSFVL